MLVNGENLDFYLSFWMASDSFELKRCTPALRRNPATTHRIAIEI